MAPADPKDERRSPYLSHVLAGAYREESERQLLQKIAAAPVPRHLAIIMDGNRRFAADHGLLIREGHAQGREKLEELLNWCLEVRLRILTVYALSTENFSRPASELETLMQQFERGFRDIAVDARVHRHRIRVRAIGNREVLPAPVQEAIRLAEEATASYDSYFYNVAIAYGGREEILSAVRALAREVKEGRLQPDQIDQQMVASRLYTADLPDPDMIFRTSGEERISNFLLWQAAYAELYFADVMWPGLTKLDFLRAIRAFQERQRRYGG